MLSGKARDNAVKERTQQYVTERGLSSNAA